MNILVVYATTEGQTGKIAEQVGDWIRERGHKVGVIDCSLTDENTELYGFDAYILAGSLHNKKHQDRLVQFARRHVGLLQRRPSAFLSVSATACRTDEASLAAARSCIGTFIEQTGWIPTVSIPVAGAMMYTKYNWLLRAVLKSISKSNGGPTDTTRDHEFTDWVALKAFIDGFLSQYVEREAPKKVSKSEPAIA